MVLFHWPGRAAGIAAEPGVLRALSPTYAISFAAAQPASAFFALAAVVLPLTESFESTIDLDNASYFLSAIDVGMAACDERAAERDSGMPRWRRRLFFALTALTADAAEYFNLPRDRTVIIGPRIPL